ncbi:MAG: hypothetical protein PF637_12530 [Spirochaetes bacterium]|nr:hypothetical protein [Spirochaetota bacterium]
MKQFIKKPSTIILVLFTAGVALFISSCDFIEETADKAKELTSKDITAKCEGDITLGGYGISFCDDYTVETAVSAEKDCSSSVTDTEYTDGVGCSDEVMDNAVATCTVTAESGVKFVKYFGFKDGELGLGDYDDVVGLLEKACTENPLYDKAEFAMLVEKPTE